jgi:hypothetical protein
MLALLAASSGCLGFGGGQEVTPAQVDDAGGNGGSTTPTSSPTGTNTATGTGTRTATGSATDSATPTDPPTATDSPTETPTPTATTTDSPTPTSTPTPTPREAQAPPPGSLNVVGKDLEVFRTDGTPTATPSVTLRNTGEGNVVFTLIELRIDLFYSSRTTGRRDVGFGYVETEFDGLGPGQSGTVTGTITFDDSTVDGTENDDDYSMEFAYRRVRYTNPT